MLPQEGSCGDRSARLLGWEGLAGEVPTGILQTVKYCAHVSNWEGQEDGKSSRGRRGASAGEAEEVTAGRAGGQGFCGSPQGHGQGTRGCELLLEGAWGLL